MLVRSLLIVMLPAAALVAIAAPAGAITADLARTCNALTAKQFPPREPGNPAAGSSRGSGRDQHIYFNKCVANNGKVDDAPATGTPAKDAPAAK